MLKDDARGVGEPLDEVVCVGKDCQGLTVKIQSQYYWRALSLPLSLSVHLLIAIVIIPNHLQARGTYYVNVEKIGHGAHWRRTYGQQVYSPFLLAFTHEVYLLALSKSLVSVFSLYFRVRTSCRRRQNGNPTVFLKLAWWMQTTVFLIMSQSSLCRYHCTPLLPPFTPAWHCRIYIIP